MARTAEPKRADSIVSLKVTLRGSKPPIWRRLLVPGSMTLGHLHDAIQAAMGWHDSHLHMFQVGERRFGDPRSLDDVANENRMTVDGVRKLGASRFVYDYDFGDSWEHTILIEKLVPKGSEGTAVPACVAGKRHCPPEDCGGIWGYAELLEVLADPAHPERQERIEWLGEGFDPEAFSVAEADAALAAIFKR